MLSALVAMWSLLSFYLKGGNSSGSVRLIVTN